MQLSKFIDVTNVQLSTGTSSVLEIDTTNCDGVMFVGVPGTTASRTWTLSLKSGATTTGFVACSSAHTIESSGAANQVLVVDVLKPRKRWLGAIFSSTTATPTYLLGLKYNCRKLPLTWSATANLPAAKVRSSLSPSST